MVPHIYYVNDLFMGKGALSTLKYLEEKNFLIFVSKTVKGLENYQKIEKHLDGKKYTEEIIEDCYENKILELRNKYNDYKPDVIVAIGGGKVIDSAKIVKFLIENPEHNLDTLKTEYFNYNKKIKLVAVPTTPSTGSESNFTALTKSEQNEKTAYINRSFIPDMAVLDYAFLEGIPLEKLIPMTGDIFGHSFESYFSKLSSQLIKIYAKSSVELLIEGIQGLKKNKDDKKSLENIMIAGHIGGIAAGNAFVGACHALAHSAEIKVTKGHSSLIMNLIKPTLTWHHEKTRNPEYIRFLKAYDVIEYDSYVESGIFDNLDNNWWAEMAIKDPAVKTNPIRMKLESMLELVNWIKTK